MDLLNIMQQVGIPIPDEDINEGKSWNEIVDSVNVDQETVVMGIIRYMRERYIPNFMSKKAWPKDTKNDLSREINKFMISMYDSIYKISGKTLLYVPLEDISDKDLALKDQNLIQRLESILIHWTRQIRDIVNEYKSDDHVVGKGLLQEIRYCRNFVNDLRNIRSQLDSDNLCTIIDFLQLARSSYLLPFTGLRDETQRKASIAENNLKFLETLEGPSLKLLEANLVDTLLILPEILNNICYLWKYCEFYHNPVEIIKLLGKASNDIINKSKALINIDRIYKGDIDDISLLLEQSVEVGRVWHLLLDKSIGLIKKICPERPWDFDISSVFSHLDAFLQRCKDFLEVIIAYRQFAPIDPLPTFGGTRGQDVRKNMLDIYESFKIIIGKLQSLEYDALDITIIKWYDDFNTFKSSVKDLEIMFSNVVSFSFETIGSLSNRLELLESFCTMAKTSFIKQVIKKKTIEFFSYFFLEINDVKKKLDFIRRNPPKSAIVPPKARLAWSALSLLKRLDMTWNNYKKMEPLLPSVLKDKDIQIALESIKESIKNAMKNTHRDWFISIDYSLSNRLNKGLLVKDKKRNGCLKVNFDKDLWFALQEMVYWEQMGMEIPYVAMEIGASRERYRILRENIFAISRDYNNIHLLLDVKEKRLFQDRLRFLDKKVFIGIDKLNWTAEKIALDFFVKEASKQCKEVNKIVKEFKEANRKIDGICEMISQKILIFLEKKWVYSIIAFEEARVAHRVLIKNFLETSHGQIDDIIKLVYKYFEGNTDEVQREWVKYLNEIDLKIERSLKITVKKSLKLLLKSLSGDKKTEVTPLFHVLMVLEKNNRVELQPTIQTLFDTIHTCMRELVSTTSYFPRFSTFSIDDKGAVLKLSSFFESISNDEETTLKLIVQITKGITSIVDRVQQFLNYWEKKYIHLWDQDKDAYIRRYEKQQKSLNAFISDITKYLDCQEEIMAEDACTNMKFMKINCGPLKQALIGHCEAWVGHFTNLLHSLAKRDLLSVHAYFASNLEALAKPLENLDKLAESVALLRRLLEEKRDITDKFDPIREKYETLHKFDVNVSDDELLLLNSIETEWNHYLQGLDNASFYLDQSKEIFKDQVLNMSNKFLEQIE